MAIFNTELRLLGGKTEATPGSAETLTTDDFDVRVREVDISTLEVEYSESSKYLDGTHTHSTVTPGLARMAIDSSIQFAVGEFIATGTEGLGYATGTLTVAGTATALTPGTYTIVQGTDFTIPGGGEGLSLEVTVDATTITALNPVAVAAGKNFEAGDIATITQVNGELFDTASAVVTIDTVAAAGAPVYTAKLPYGKYLESAGLKITATDPTNPGNNDGLWTIVPQKSEDCNTITEALYDVTVCDGGNSSAIEYKGKGMMSTLTIESTTAGAPFTFNFSTQGAIAGVSEILGLDIPTFDDDGALHTPSARMLNTVIRVTQVNGDGTAMTAPVAVPIEFCTNTLSLDTGNTIAEITCQADAYGIKQSLITSREPMFSVEPLLERLGDWNFWNALNSENVYHIEVINYVDDAHTIEQLKIDMPRTQMIKADGSDDNGYRRLSQQFRVLKNIQAVDPINVQNDFVLTIGGITIDETA